MTHNELQLVTDDGIMGSLPHAAERGEPFTSSGIPRRLLALTNMLPYPPTSGGQMRDWEVIRALASLGCEINLLSFGQNEQLDKHRNEIHKVCASIEVISHPQMSLSSSGDYLGRLRALPGRLPYAVTRFQSKAMQERIVQWVESGRVDAVLSNTPYPLANVPASLPVPLIVNCHNVEHVILRRYLEFERSRLRRAYAWIECRKLEHWEKEVCLQASLLLVCSEDDRSVMEMLCPGPAVYVVPNVVDVDRYTSSYQSDAATVLYTGGMDWFPNRDAVEFFVTAILPDLRRLNPKVQFIVAGRRGPEKFHQDLAKIPNVEFRGPVSDMRAEIARATVCVVPLRIGSGTRLKILEAAAMGKPIVSTRVGAEGLSLVEGKEILLADQPDAFARLVSDLVDNVDRCTRLGQAAHSSVQKHYGLAVLHDALSDILEFRGLKLLNDGHGPLVIKSREDAARTVEVSDEAERGFLSNRMLLVVDLCLVLSAFIRPILVVFAAGLLVADFGFFAWRRRETLRRYEDGKPRLVTPEDFAAISEMYRQKGIPEPTMTDWASVAHRSSHENWRADLRYHEIITWYRQGLVADVGCGDGRLCWKYHICSPELYTGIDPGSGLVSELRERTGGRANAIVSTAEDLKLQDSSIDFLVCSEAFEHLPEPGLALREFARVVKPGGRIVIQSPNAVRLRNLNPFHACSCVLGRAMPFLVMRKVIHENTFIKAYTYHWDFTRQDIEQYMAGLPLRLEFMRGATYRFNPQGNVAHRLLRGVSRMPFIHWFGWDLTIVLTKQNEYVTDTVIVPRKDAPQPR
jgi:polysaccharide biosynthesis protein PslH